MKLVHQFSAVFSVCTFAVEAFQMTTNRAENLCFCLARLQSPDGIHTLFSFIDTIYFSESTFIFRCVKITLKFVNSYNRENVTVSSRIHLNKIAQKIANFVAASDSVTSHSWTCWIYCRTGNAFVNIYEFKTTTKIHINFACTRAHRLIP